MPAESFKLNIVLILTVGFAFASLLGYLSHRIKLSPILGYLIAGYLIGPFSPGFVADLKLAEELAEIGVVLMMFGVGLHFKWQDLVIVRNIAIIGAIGQTLISSVLGACLASLMGWPLENAIIFGLSLGVASTVVLIRMLTENSLLYTPQGHIAVGWLVVEDIITVIVLLLVPSLASTSTNGSAAFHELLGSISLTFFKFILLGAIVFIIVRKIIGYIFSKIIATHSHELFTLTILAITFIIATGSALVFGTSLALGAFLAGMVIGQTDVRHQASTNILSLKDAFVVIFFLSIGMLFNPYAIIEHFLLFIGVLAIILIIKPLSAFLIARLMKYPFNTALTVAIALAQIGEFSFILGEEALKYHILPDEGFDIIIACALISIAINPLLFKLLKKNPPDQVQTLS